MATQQILQEPFDSTADSSGVVIHPPVTYNPETVELHPQLKSQDLRIKRRCVLCWSCWMTVISTSLVSAIGTAIVVPLVLSSQARYEPCIVVFCLVMVAAIFVGFLKNEGNRIAEQNATPSKKFLVFFVTTIILTVSVIVSAAVALYIFINGEYHSCSEALNNTVDLENSLCSEDYEIRYVIAVLTLVGLVCMTALALALLGLHMGILYRFACLKVHDPEHDGGKVIVTRKDNKGHKVTYAYTSEEVHRLEPN